MAVARKRKTSRSGKRGAAAADSKGGRTRTVRTYGSSVFILTLLRLALRHALLFELDAVDDSGREQPCSAELWAIR
jgi:hypothetical protein